MASLSPMPSSSADHIKSLNLETMTSKGFKKLLDSQSLVDVTLACDGGQISAHRVVLSACSSYLHKILKTHPVKHPIIILPELNIKDIKILVNYMYTGELLTTNAFSPSLLRTAAVLNINSLNDFFNESSSNQNSPSSSVKNINKSSSNAGNNTSMSNINNLNISNLDEFLGTTGSYINHLEDDDFDDNNNNDDGQYNQDALMDDSSAMPLGDYSREDDVMSANDSMAQYNLTQNQARPHRRSPPLSKNGTHLDMQFDADKEIRCHLCDIKLSDVKCLYRHVLTRHLPDRWGYRCEFCDREFSRDDHLMRHYTTKHKGMEFNREKIRETKRHNREMAKNFHDSHSTA